jgi:DNA methylase/ParB-like nuclease domain
MLCPQSTSSNSSVEPELNDHSSIAHTNDPNAPNTLELAGAQIVQIDIHLLRPHPKSPRTHKQHKIRRLADNIAKFKMVSPLVCDHHHILHCGHARLAAAKLLGLKTVPVIFAHHLSPEQFELLMIADNRLGEMGDWNPLFLKEIFLGIEQSGLHLDLELSGFSITQIDLITLDEGAPPDEDSAALKALESGPVICQLGDHWALGVHRLLCADATQAPSYETLLENQSVAMSFSDFPYNVSAKHIGGNGKICHPDFVMASSEMSKSEFTDFLTTVNRHIAHHSLNGSLHYGCMDWRHLEEIQAAGGAVFSRLLNLCVWAKHQAGMGSFYRSAHELVLVYKHGSAPHRNNIQLGRFGRYRSNVWNYPGIQAMRHGEEGDLLALHPTVKPVQMVADAILDCTAKNDIVLDVFVGSGTTLLAAQRVQRRCYAMELDPKYVDVAIVRWQNLTGENAIHLPTGLSYTQLKEQRLSEACTKQLEVHHD